MLGKRCGSTRECGGDPQVTCNRGVCMASCADAGCGEGQFCATLEKSAFCLVPCDHASNCPTGAPCKVYWPERKEVCAVTDLGAACRGVQVTDLCTTSCGPQYFTTRCDDGGFCAGRSECAATSANGCECWNNQPLECNGSPCGANSCFGTSYNCHSTALGTTACLDEPHDFAGKCLCTDGREIPVTCGETSSCEHRCSVGCSLTAQDCLDSWASKCTYRALQPPVTPRAKDRVVCVDLTDTKIRDASCTRTKLPDGGTEVGIDDCAAGLVCEPAGAPRGEMRCRKLCTSTSECGSGQVCARTVTTFPPAGYCLPSGCTVGAIDCGPGRSCTFVRDVERGRTTACKYDGDAGELEPCLTDADCAHDLGCGGGQCRRTCSSQRPCPTGSCAAGDFPEPPLVPSLCY